MEIVLYLSKLDLANLISVLLFIVTLILNSQGIFFFFVCVCVLMSMCVCIGCKPSIDRLSRSCKINQKVQQTGLNKSQPQKGGKMDGSQGYDRGGFIMASKT